ncbi:hypothetical protein [Psychrobacillus sp. FJAT-21963]|uniref:hypothetical protein n=1 Tax=Psychrobacillus sp. FJAT-21963 TaxID=1712028 RepID=UPI0006F3B525|nr:hypothetical protein [Psychrobacillus sp. FJAT-21963]KQL37105.1 hypothetical protein AN959_03415 [Psychrobacillus sp. FJAT-21963]
MSTITWTFPEPLFANGVPSIETVKTTMNIGNKTLFTAAGVTAIGTANTVSAQSVSTITSAFEPVKDLLISLADPLCYIMFVWGCVECIVGRPASGLDRMKYASIGFIAINWIPVIMNTIRSVAPN